MRRIALAIALAASLSAQVRLTAYPQKIVTRYEPGDRSIPRAVANADGSLAVTTPDGAQWRIVEHGVIRTDPRASGLDRVQYFNGRRYLPPGKADRIASDGTRSGVWVRSAEGFTRIEMRPMRLEQKAAFFEERISARHDRLGFVADCGLAAPGDLSRPVPTHSDNDGLWTAMYAAAECFRFAATKSPDALVRARKATEAVLSLEQVTGRPGYPARSYQRRGDPPPGGGTWHWTPDGQICWKSDTSSDEIVGHYFIWGLAWELLPDPALKAKIAATAARVTDHILDHGLNLTDIHGGPTYWGRWSPEYFASPRGIPDSPLNALEILSFLRTAHRITGNPRYERELRRIAFDLGYARTMNRLDELRRQINYSDEELAMLPFYMAFRYEKDPELLASYRTALAQWWRNIQRERNPLWTFIYMTSGSDGKADPEAAVHTLYRIPMDLVTWRIENSWRSGIQWAGEADRFGRREALTWIPPDERPVMKWNGNPFVVDGGGAGTSEDDGAFFLLPYWMGRYHKFIAE